MREGATINANTQAWGAVKWSGVEWGRSGRVLDLFDHWKLHFRLWFNAFMSIILPLFTIPLEILCIYFSNAFTSVRYDTRPDAPFLLIISKNVFIYVSNNSLVFFHLFTCSILAFLQRIAIIFVLLFHFFDHPIFVGLPGAHISVRTRRAFILYHIFRLPNESIHTWGITQKHDRMKVRALDAMAAGKVTPRIICIEMYTLVHFQCSLFSFFLSFSLKIHLRMYVYVCVRCSCTSECVYDSIS